MHGTWDAVGHTQHGLITFSGPDNSGVVQDAYFALAVANTDSRATGHVWFFGGGGGSNPEPAPVLKDYDWVANANTPVSWPVPANTSYIVVSIVETNAPVDYYVELRAR